MTSSAHRLAGGRLLDSLVDALLDEDLLEGQPVLPIQQLVAVVLELGLQLRLQLLRSAR